MQKRNCLVIDLNEIKIELVKATSNFAGRLHAMDIDITAVTDIMKDTFQSCESGPLTVYPLSKPFKTNCLIIGMKYQTVNIGAKTLVAGSPYGVKCSLENDNYELQYFLDPEAAEVARKHIVVEMLDSRGDIEALLHQMLVEFAKSLGKVLLNAPYVVFQSPLQMASDSQTEEVLGIHSNMFIASATTAMEAICTAFTEIDRNKAEELFSQEEFHNTALYLLNKADLVAKYLKVSEGQFIGLFKESAVKLQTNCQAYKDLIPMVGSSISVARHLSNLIDDELSTVMAEFSILFQNEKENVESAWVWDND